MRHERAKLSNSQGHPLRGNQVLRTVCKRGTSSAPDAPTSVPLSPLFHGTA